MAEKDEVFIALYHATYPSIVKYITSKCKNIDEVPDIIQRTYLNYYERLRKHGSPDDPKKYLFKIAKSELTQHYLFLGKHKHDIPVFSKTADDQDFEAMEALLERDIPAETHLDTDEMWRYIKSQDPLTVKIFILYFHYDEKLADIAKFLDINESTIKSRLYRTIEKMREKFNFE